MHPTIFVRKICVQHTILVRNICVHHIIFARETCVHHAILVRTFCVHYTIFVRKIFVHCKKTLPVLGNRSISAELFPGAPTCHYKISCAQDVLQNMFWWLWHHSISAWKFSTKLLFFAFLRSGRRGRTMCFVEGLGHEFCRNLGVGQCSL